MERPSTDGFRPARRPERGSGKWAAISTNLGPHREAIFASPAAEVGKGLPAAHNPVERRAKSNVRTLGAAGRGRAGTAPPFFRVPQPTQTQSAYVARDDSLREILSLGVLEAVGLQARALPEAFEQEAKASCDRLRALYEGKQPADIPGVAETRSLFHRLDIDPTKTRPSSEALLRRVLQGKGLPRVSPAVDVCNLSSLESQLPLGLYDREAVKGAVHVRVGKEGEGYPGIRRQRVNLSGRLLLADEEGPFGAPTADSLRTAVAARTRALLVVIFCPRERAGGHLSGCLERIADLLTRHCSAGVIAVRIQN